jgi:small subunit ribosomal protein S5
MAKSHASQRLLYINRYEDRTLFHNFYEEYYYTKVFAEKKASGYGLVCHRVIKKICDLAGIKDVYAKVEGSQNPRNVAKAFIGGLINQKKYQDIADEKNLHVVEIKPELNNFPVLLARAKKPIIEDKLQSNDYQKNIDLYLFQNKFMAEKKKKQPFYANYDSYKRYCALRDKVCFLVEIIKQIYAFSLINFIGQCTKEGSNSSISSAA